jgi:hypothetical protein
MHQIEQAAATENETFLMNELHPKQMLGSGNDHANIRCMPKLEECVGKTRKHKTTNEIHRINKTKSLEEPRNRNLKDQRRRPHINQATFTQEA